MLHTIARLALVGAAVYAMITLGDWAVAKVQTLPAASQGPLMFGLVVATLLAYALLLALPFVPGIEIGIMLLALRGGELALFVYLATLAGLALAFLAGRYLPYSWLRRIALDLRLRRAADLLARIAPLSRPRRVALLRKRLPRRLAPYLLRYRYLGLGLLLNLPGNSVLGGGGGLCLIAGLSHLFSTRAALLTIALAVAPVPLAVWYFDLALWGHIPGQPE